jgi:N-acetylglucosamine kinase-like BadF-type ATPase
MKVVLAIDGGGSRTRCLAIDREGRIAGAGASGPSNHLLVAMETVRQSLVEATGKALAEGGLRPEDVVCVSAGLAGVDHDGTGGSEIEGLLCEIGFTSSIVNGDMVIAHAGALGGRPGVLALAGTGSCVLGVGPHGERVKVGGWGPVYGDEGSAYRIGQKALVAAAKAYDGRGPLTSLVPALLRALEIRDFRDTVARVYVEGMEPRQIALLSRVAYEVAESGDETARDIFMEAGEELAESVAAAINRLNVIPAEMLVSYQGSVLEACSLVREKFGAVLKQAFPEITIIPPQFEPVIGALLVGFEKLGLRLHGAAWEALGRRTLSELLAGTK